MENLLVVIVCFDSPKGLLKCFWLFVLVDVGGYGKQAGSGVRLDLLDRFRSVEFWLLQVLGSPF